MAVQRSRYYSSAVAVDYGMSIWTLLEHSTVASSHVVRKGCKLSAYWGENWALRGHTGCHDVQQT